MGAGEVLGASVELGIIKDVPSIALLGGERFD